jgi:hypothetical protein
MRLREAGTVSKPALREFLEGETGVAIAESVVFEAVTSVVRSIASRQPG